MSRAKFDQQLNDINQLVIDLSTITKKHLEEAYTSYVTKDVNLARTSIASDIKVNKLYEELDQQAIQLILQQQPVATDLRKIIGIIKIATDIERIADFAVNIARSSIQLINNQSTIINKEIEKMFYSMLQMYDQTFQAFVTNDRFLAQEMIDYDDIIDQYYVTILYDISELNKEAHLIEECLQLGFLARYLERTADHLTNIAENILYINK